MLTTISHFPIPYFPFLIPHSPFLVLVTSWFCQQERQPQEMLFSDVWESTLKIITDSTINFYCVLSLIDRCVVLKFAKNVLAWRQ